MLQKLSRHLRQGQALPRVLFWTGGLAFLFFRVRCASGYLGDRLPSREANYLKADLAVVHKRVFVFHFFTVWTRVTQYPVKITEFTQQYLHYCFRDAQSVPVQWCK